MGYSTLLLDVADGVATITLDRPDAANAIDLTMATELLDVALALDGDASVRAVLLRGNGRMFCAGGDVRTFAAAGEGVPELLRRITTPLHAAIARLVRLDAPVIVAVQGSAAGAGLGLVCAADLVLAAESAKFVVAYTGIGVTPDGSTSYYLPRLVGQRRAVELTLTNRVLRAPEALEWGLVTRVVPDAELDQRARLLAASIAAGPTRAFGAATRLLRDSWTATLETQMESESVVLRDTARTADAREGLSAFVEKRPPVFEGR
ncbi:MAG TPA: enoyl-CoA hydratase-related protein [Acidimicrobiia bacterium]|nr:enoyl-CoA hydratase-related protein [Acidimicrobiia bacterium]